MATVYLDHAALTPVCSEAVQAMAEALTTGWGHPSATHAFGRRSRARLDEADDQVADLLGCRAREVEWYSSATDAIAEAVAASAIASTGPIACSRIEHPSVIDQVRQLGQGGRAVRWVDMPEGEFDEARAPLTFDEAALAIFSPLNHELGTAPAHIDAHIDAFMARSRGFVVVDAVQGAAWMDLRALANDPAGRRTWIVIAAQKLGGPPGAAVLRVPPAFDRKAIPRRSSAAAPWLAAVGMGAACQARQANRAALLGTARELGAEMLRLMRAIAPDLKHNGAGACWGPILSLSVPGVPGRALEAALDLRGVCVSRTAACRQESVDHAPAVRAAYPDDDDGARAAEATRWSFGATTTRAEIETAVERWADAVRHLRAG